MDDRFQAFLFGRPQSCESHPLPGIRVFGRLVIRTHEHFDMAARLRKFRVQVFGMGLDAALYARKAAQSENHYRDVVSHTVLATEVVYRLQRKTLLRQH